MAIIRLSKPVLLVWLVIIAIVVGLFFSKSKQPLRIGYCPTMLPHALSLKNDRSVELIRYGSSQEVLASLAAGVIDVALVGRKAYASELTEQMAYRQIDPEATTLVKKIGAIEEQAFLLPWREVDYAEVELVVLHDEFGNKLAEHRTPFYYYAE